MKRLILLLIALSSLGVTSQNFIIRGTLTNVKTGKAVLYLTDKSETNKITEADISNSTFTLKGTIENAHLGKLIIKHDDVDYESTLFIESGVIKVTLSADKNTVYNNLGYASIKALSGTPNNDVLHGYEAEVATYEALPEFKNLEVVQKELSDFNNSGSADADMRRALLKKLGKASALVIKKYEDTKERFFMDSNGSLAALYLIVAGGSGLENTDFTLEQKQNFLKYADKDAKSSMYYQTLSENVKRIAAVEIGEPAPQFTLKNEKGKDVSLNSLKGKYVLLDFWAYYCAPCIAAFPKLRENYKNYKDQGFEIVSISRDLNEDKWLKGLEKHQNPWLQLIDKAENGDKYQPMTANKYNIRYMPTYVLIDKEGKIMLHSTSEEQLETQLKDIFQ